MYLSGVRHFSVVKYLSINYNDIDISLGFNKNYNVSINEHWVPWGRCFTIKSYNVSLDGRILILPIHEGERSIGNEHHISTSEPHLSVIPYSGMYLSPETKLLGLYDNKWPLPVVGINLASSEYMDYPLKMSKNIAYSRNGEACEINQVPVEYISCIEEMAVKRYKEAPQCANGMQVKCFFSIRL